MNSESRHELNMLRAVEQDGTVSQRGLALKLGIAVGLTNIYLKRLARKGYIKCVNVRSNRLLYLITPRGIAEKTRLTYEYMEYSLRLYRETRQFLKNEVSARLAADHAKVAIYGTGEAAELAYLSLRELAMEPVAVFGAGPSHFLGLPVLPLQKHAAVVYDVIIIASLDDPGDLVSTLLEAGVKEEKMCPLRPSTWAPARHRHASLTRRA
jgi:hypothetical protein